ncbi:unnamed protein product [Alopecurus aequalis]
MAVLNNGKVLAVQTLQKEKKGEKNHKNFAYAVSTLDHKNLLKLEGYCVDRRGTFLCYEHQQPYQTLEDRLLAGTCNTQLNWQERVDILRGICEGLQYLEDHKSAIKIRICLKVDNILLHEDKTTRVLTPKLAEFGISKKPDEDVSPGGSGPTGRRKDEFSPEIDIKSFGIILMVMSSDLLKTSNKLDPFGKELIADEKKDVRKNDLVAWSDPFLSEDDCQDEIEECIELALKCTTCEYEALQPSLAEIAQSLVNLGGKRQEKSYGGYSQQNLIHDDETSEGLGYVKVDHVKEYGYDELRIATENFADHYEIGRGAFGIIYKAILNDKVIAVKKLREEKFSGQFLNEVSILKALRHKNLVKLEGYSFSQHGTMLCYEHLPGGTLQDRLHGQSGILDWKQRYHIIQGICKGLQYLHDECPDGVSIVHMDLKTDNILIHVDIYGVLTPKIGDFGISWPLDLNKQHEYVDKPAGNINCTPPEYHTSTHSDKKSHYGLCIIDQVQNHKKKNDLYTLIDQSLGTAYQEEILECIEVALNCVADEYIRPNIAEISLKLAQITEGKVRKPLPRNNATRQEKSDELEKRATLEYVKMMAQNNMLAANTDGSQQEQQQEVLLSYPDEASSDKSKTEATSSSSMTACNYVCIDDTRAIADDHASIWSTPSDLHDTDQLDFTLDFDEAFEEPSDDEIDSTTARTSTMQGKEAKKALKQLYEALRDVLPHQIAESSGFIEEMVKEILANGGGSAPSDNLQAGLMDLVVLSKDEDGIRRAKDRVTQKAQINERKSQCARLKGIMQEHAVEARKLATQQTQLKKRKEMLRSELEKIESELSDLPASIAQEKSMGIAAQAQGRRLAEQVREEEAEIGDTSADDALLAQVRRVQKGVCAQLEGILQRS